MSAVIRNVYRLFARCVHGEAWPYADERQFRSDFLFVQPSPFHGAARIVDLFGVYDIYNISKTSAHADANALAADLCTIGEELNAVIVPELEAAESAAQIELPFHANHNASASSRAAQ